MADFYLAVCLSAFGSISFIGLMSRVQSTAGWMFGKSLCAKMKSIIQYASSKLGMRSNTMEVQQYIDMDIARAKSHEPECELHPHAADTRGARSVRNLLENPVARHDGGWVRRQPSKLASESALYRHR
jgi:hypothetical protein